MSQIKLEIKIPRSNDGMGYQKIKGQLRKCLCALLNNNGGGEIKVVAADDVLINLDKVLLPAEQELSKVLNTFEIQKNFAIYKEDTRSFTLKIDGSPFLITSCYNLFLPTETQVLELRPVTDHSVARKIIQREDAKVNKDAPPQVYTYDHDCGLRESQTVQFKNVGTKEIADRIIKNNFVKYVSAFANHRGGRIYYGINDGGIVKGLELTDEAKEIVGEKLTQEIKDMRCSKSKSEPEFSNKCSITFAPVKDNQGQPLPSTFLLIVFIPPFPGGVFTTEPESYYVCKGEVKKMSFRDWLVYFKMPRLPWSITFIPQTVPPVTWSSPNNRKIYRLYTTKLVQARNNNNMKDVKNVCKVAKKIMQKTGNSCAYLVAMSEKVAIPYKRKKFTRARTLLLIFSKSIGSVGDHLFHDVKKLYLESRIRRAEGNWKNSYEIAIDGLQKMLHIPAEFITVWFYLHIAMLANIIGVEESNPARFNEAMRWLCLAMRDAYTLDEFPAGFLDLQQKLHIYQAVTLLRCSLTGRVSALTVPRKDINAAANELSNVFSSVLKGNKLSRYREIQFLSCQSCIFIRQSEDSNIQTEMRRELLERAGTFVLVRAGTHQCNFADMVGYANNLLHFISQKLALI